MASKLPPQQLATSARNQAAVLTQQQEQQRQACLKTLSSLDCLRTVPTEELSRLIDHCVFRAFTPGAVLLNEREQSGYLYLLLDGNIQLTLHDKEGHEVLLGVLGRGDCCGEGLLFGDFFRRAGAYAETRCYALQIALSDLRPLLATMPMLAKALRDVYRRRVVESTLARVPLFSQLLPLERLALAVLLKPSHHPRASMIVQQGEPGDALYLIEAGQVLVEQNGQTIASLSDGDFFGEIALLSDQPHNATVRALTPTDVLVLPAADFHQLLGQRPDLEAQIRKVIERRLNNNAKLHNDRDRARQLMLAVNHGLLRGSHLLVRTPDLCPPGCRICEQACAARHGNIRLHLNGVQIDGFDVLDTCRQCRSGAECVEACPEDAIVWNDRGVLVINDSCTGCGACVSACPYEAVTSVPLKRKHLNGPLGQLWEEMQQRIRQRFQPIPLEPSRPTRRADKCDFCHGYNDMACRSACPTGSLQLVPVEELFPL